MAMTIVEGTRLVTGGVDTHLDVHVAAALDDIGGLLGVDSFEASTAGNNKLREWLASFGEVALVGVEGAGSCGAGLARSLRSAGVASSRWIVPTAKHGGAPPSPTRPTRWRPPALHCPDERRARARPETATSKPSASSSW